MNDKTYEAHTTQWMAFVESARGHRRHRSAKQILSIMLTFMLSAGCLMFGTISLVSAGVAQRYGLELLALTIGGGMLVSMIYAITE
jgi:hypothetical protein